MFSLWNSLNSFGRAIFLTFLCIVIIFLAEVRADVVLRNSLDIVMTPTAAFFSRASSNVLGIGSFVGNIAKMGEENKLLRERIQTLESENVQLEELTLENQHLRDQLDLAAKSGFDIVSARVIAREPLGAVKWISINRGSDDGLSENMPVIVSQGLLVGYIQEVYASSARVVLMLDPSVEVPARVQKSRADGIIKGQQLGQGLFMDFIPQGAELSRGNTVVTSGLGSYFPSGLLIGYVQTVYSEPNEIFQRADILPAVDFDRLEQVMVIRNFDE